MLTIPYKKVTLSNGLDVVVHEDRSLPMVAINVWYHVGSKNEEVGRTGFAHLFEHMMFEGSKNHNKSFFEPLQKVGANLNGSTTSDRTNYWETVPANYLELALWLEADRMGFLLDALDQNRFDIQRDVVKNERRQSYENRPYGMAHLALQPAVFPNPHPYSWPTIGSQEDLDAAALDDAKDFFRLFYAPSNASLSIAGDVSAEEAIRQVEHYFGDLPPGPPINRVGRMDSGLKGEVQLTLQDKIQLPRIYIAWPTVPMFDPAEAPLDILASVLGEGRSSRLTQILVYEKQIARDVRIGNYGQAIAGEFNIQITCNPDSDLSELQAIVEEELDRIRREAPSRKEIQRAKNIFESDRVRYLERLGGFYGRADLLNHYNIMANDPSVINTDMERYIAVEPEDVSQVASTLDGNRVRLVVLPEDSRTATPPTLDRSKIPSATTPGSFTPPVPKRESLPNGLNILYVEKRGLPMVTFGLIVNAGATTDPTDTPGLSHMTAAMLPEGTTTRSSKEIADEMEFLGTSLGQDVGREHMLLTAEALTPNWPKALEIVADVAQNPSFPEEGISRVRKEQLTDLRRISDDPTAISQRAYRALLYGLPSPYGHYIAGTEDSVESMTKNLVAEHYVKTYGPTNATLLVVGDVTGDEVVKQAEAHFGSWHNKVSSTLETKSQEPENANGQIIYLADKPGAAQSVIQAGHLTVPYDNPDYHALNLLNYVFGGQPTARLFLNLREDKGYSYGYYSSIDWATGPSMLIAGGAVQTEVTRASVDETLKEYSGIKGDRPVTINEYNNARDGIFRAFPSMFETQGQLMQQLIRLVAFSLPHDYYSTYLDSLKAVTLKKINQVAAKCINNSNLTILVVGDRSVIEQDLREVGIPIVQVDYEGHLID
jgi:zinc protease